jgi:hypothetical protein
VFPFVVMDVALVVRVVLSVVVVVMLGSGHEWSAADGEKDE